MVYGTKIKVFKIVKLNHRIKEMKLDSSEVPALLIYFINCLYFQFYNKYCKSDFLLCKTST